MSKAPAYGGVVVDGNGRVLLREPAGHFDGYVWTFAKGRPDRGEAPEATALREVREETGMAAEIVAPVEGRFEGGTTRNVYFLMRPVKDTARLDRETASVRWASAAEAQELIGQTTNAQGRARDLAVLQAGLRAWQQRCAGERAAVWSRLRPLRLARGFIEALAPQVSVSLFTWFKAPGNLYLTFFPTALIPTVEDERALKDAAVGQRIFEAVVQPCARTPRPLSLGLYGGEEILVPGWAVGREEVRIWPPARDASGQPASPPGGTATEEEQEDGARQAMLRVLDTAWLTARGKADPATSQVVLQWLDRMMLWLGTSPGAGMEMKFGEEPIPFVLWVAEVEDGLGRYDELWWEGYSRQQWY